MERRRVARMYDTKNEPRNTGKSRQFLAALIVNLLSLSSGIGCGWPSPVIPQLRSKNPPIGDGPMSDDQISWISTLLPIGSLLMIPFCGIIVERIGRKNFTQLTSLPHILSWLLIIFGQSHLSLYAARLLIGVSASMTIFISPMFCSEIASEDIRGILSSLTMFAANSGILFAYTAGSYLSYRMFATVSLLFPLLFVVAFVMIPETPAYLVREDRQQQAHKSLMFYRGNNQDLVARELSSLQSEVDTSRRISSTSLGVKDFLSDRATRLGLIVCFILLGGQQLSGILALLSYAEPIFQRAGSSISPDTSTIIIAVIQMFSSYASTMLVDRAGRRPLVLISCLGMASSHLLLAVFFYLQRNQHDLSSVSWLPLVAFSIYISFYCLGIGPVPFVFTAEVFRLQVSSSASTVCYVFYWIMSSCAVKAFGSGMDVLGLDVCSCVLASFCVLCFLGTYLLMPETKGRRREDIVAELAGNVSSCQDHRHCAEV